MALLRKMRLLAAVALAVVFFGSLAGPIANAQPRQQELVIIPGDSAMQALVVAVRKLKQEPAFSRVRVRLLPQSLLTDDDLKALQTADVIVARHMIGNLSERVAPAMQAAAQRGAKLWGAGSDEGVSAKLGLAEDLTLRAYLQAGGADNMVNLLRFIAKRDLGLPLSAEPPRELPQDGLWNPHTGQVFERFEDYAAAYGKARLGSAGRDWVGLVINRGQAYGSGDEAAKLMALELEKRGFNVVPVFGFPSPVPIERHLLDASGQSRVAAVVAMGMKLGNVPDKIGPVLERLGVPLVNAITLYRATRQEWEDSPIGLDLAERAWQISGPEFAGIIAPTVVATKERRRDAQTGLDYIAEVPIPERVTRLVDRVQNLVALRTTPAADKRIAVIYYNSPPGAANVGASYLNVLPRSLWQILQRMEAQGYDVKGRPETEDALFKRLHEHGTTVGSWSPGALAKLVAGGNAALLPVAEYRRWFDKLPAKLRESMLKAWGEPEAFTTMVWHDTKGQGQFVFPAQHFGKQLFVPQPARGWGDVKKSYHDVTLPPHHQYVAFYLWLQKTYKAHAMVHVGTHGTHEWLSGKEVGFTEADPSEVMVGAVPQVYPYIVDVVGEGLQAKRRGMATLISHMTPPFDQAGLNPDLVALHGLLDDHQVATEKSETAAEATLLEINRVAGKMGILKDIGKTELKNAEDVNDLHEYLHEIGQEQTPFGLHTFGVAPERKLLLATAEAMVSRMPDIPRADKSRRVAELVELLASSAKAELDALMAALAGRYVAASPGGDPLRNPASLPTGRNLYGFDPSRLPTPGVYAQGSKLATALIESYREKHKALPTRMMFILWSGETMRHEGVLESQILALLGVKPKWDMYGRVSGLEVIPRSELGRARVDVTITPSGLYRDSLPMLMQLLDDAVSAVKNLPEADNAVRLHLQGARTALAARGIAPDMAERLAAVRIFTEPPGAYGTGLDNTIIAQSNDWSDERQVAEVYFKRVGHLFGQGFWGDAPPGHDDAGGKALAVDVFKMALDGVKVVQHSRASNLYGTLDNDDVFQYLGGAAMAVRQVNGATPDTLLLNMADPSNARHETLDQFLGREMRARYLNPTWINAMLKEGYAGARLVSQVVDNLWGWQVTVPEAVDGAKWQEMFETYVQDKHRLDIQNKFRAAKNLLAYQSLVDRMLVAVNKGYWKPSPDVVAELHAVNLAVIQEAGVACSPANCSSEAVTRLAKEIDQKAMREAVSGFGLDQAGAPSTAARAQTPMAAQVNAPTPTPTPPPPTTDVVRGQEMREMVQKQQPLEQLIWTYAGLIALVVLGGMGYQAWRTRRESAAPNTTLAH